MFLRSHPFPTRIGPQFAPLVAVVPHESQVLAIRDVVSVDRERRHFNAMLLKLIIPAENPFLTASSPSVAVPAGISTECNPGLGEVAGAIGWLILRSKGN